jgi:DNA-binding MarR family transcriptional regulator
MTAALPEAERPLLGEALELLRLVWEVDHALQSASKRMEAGLGVTGPQRLVLRIVGRFPRIPAGQLADTLRIHPSTVSDVVKRLEKRGLLQRARDPHDGRRVLLGLTERGRRLDAERGGTIEDAVRRALAQLSPADVRGARATMTALAGTLEATADGSVAGAARARP